jgi:hypothetical protein
MKHRRRLIYGLFGLGFAACSVSGARGDWSYDFESPLPASFVFDPHGPPRGTLSGGIDGGVLRLTDPQFLGGGSPRGGFGSETSQVFDDVRVSAIVNAAGNSDDVLGVFVRGPVVHEQCCGPLYDAHLSFVSGSGFLSVRKVVPTPTATRPPVIIRSSSPEQGNQPLLTDLDRSYFLEFTVIDNVLDARLFDQPGGAELLHVHYVDDQGLGGPPLAPGIAGVSAARQIGTLDATFDNVSATAVPEPRLVGDYNQNGTVDAADYVVWRTGLGTTYTQTDYDVWRANFGQSAGSGAALPSAEPLSAAVPEPASFVLLMMAVGCCICRRGSHKKLQQLINTCYRVCVLRSIERSCAPGTLLK